MNVVGDADDDGENQDNGSGNCIEHQSGRHAFNFFDCFGRNFARLNFWLVCSPLGPARAGRVELGRLCRGRFRSRLGRNVDFLQRR